MIVIEITLSGALAPSDLPRLLHAACAALPDGGTEGVVLSGRLPVWAYAALSHLYHPRPWVGTFEPRLAAAVVVQSHTEGVKVGDTLSLDDATKVEVTF